MEIEFDITKMVEKIAMQAKENQEEFIFETIQPYCENILQMKINKEELKQILLNGTQKQQPCEDCISRKEALRHRHIIYDDYGVGHSLVRVDEIEQIPSVTPQRPKGKWTQKAGSRVLWCSVCENGIPEEIPYAFDYCPNCGADMRGEEGNE